jgi:RNA polymerase sigma-70 factor, ECF subfamily
MPWKTGQHANARGSRRAGLVEMVEAVDRGAVTAASPGEVTRLLLAWRHGDRKALENLIPLVYDELHRIAQRCMQRERPGHTLQPTALVNEAYLKLTGRADIAWQNRAHFFAVAARSMRRVLVDHARGRATKKRGGGGAGHVVDTGALSQPKTVELLVLDESLARLTALDEEQGRIVELRFFGGLTEEETAEVLDVSQKTVHRKWLLAKAFLQRELEASSP